MTDTKQELPFVLTKEEASYVLLKAAKDKLYAPDNEFTHSFTAIFTKEKNETYSVRFPNVDGCFASGNDLQEVLYMAEDALCMILCNIEDEGKEIPSSDNPFDVAPLLQDNEFAIQITVNTKTYRTKSEVSNF